MLSEEQILKDAIAYLQTVFVDDGVLIMPKNQSRVPAIPCITLTLSSQVSVTGIKQEILANVQIHATVYANNVYAPSGSMDGVHTIFDKLNLAMQTRLYGRSNQTEPYYNVGNGCWNKDGYFTKKSNTF